jgi:hypothetical protein
MARLFKAMPELLILIKAMVASLRSCAFVFFLLFFITYVFGIAFRQLTADSDLGTKYFNSVPKAMYTLWVDGSLLDAPHEVSVALWDFHPAMAFLFWIFGLLSALTVMNMLIGVLCEVVSAVAGAEKEALSMDLVKHKLQHIIVESGLDRDGDGSISKEEFSSLLEIPSACEAFSDVGVDVFMLVDNIDFIFAGDHDDEEEDKQLTFEDFMALILDLRGSNTATVKDVVDLKKFIKRHNTALREEFRAVKNGTSAQSSQQDAAADETSCKKGSGALRGSSWAGTGLEQGTVADSPMPPLTMSNMRQELEAVLMHNLVPELSKVCVARQAEMFDVLHALSAQIHRDLGLGKPSPASPDVDFLRKAANFGNPPPRVEGKAGDALLDKPNGIPGSPPALPPVAPGIPGSPPSLPPVAPPSRRDPDGPQRGNGNATNAVLAQPSPESATPDGPQRGNGHATNAVLAQPSPETRFANDGHAYTYEKFTEHYGQADGQRRWENAATKKAGGALVDKQHGIPGSPPALPPVTPPPHGDPEQMLMD